MTSIDENVARCANCGTWVYATELCVRCMLVKRGI